MRILVVSHYYFPVVGGAQTVAKVLSFELCRLGHKVEVVTATCGDGEADLPFRIIRNPGVLQLFQLGAKADVVLVHGIGAKLTWPILLAGHPVVTVLHIDRSPTQEGRSSVAEVVRRLAHSFTLKRSNRIVAVSKALASQLTVPNVVVYNPYDASVFALRPHVLRKGSLIFAGRLIPEKGGLILLKALLVLRERGHRPDLMMVGDGPERPLLEGFCAAHDLTAQVCFAGQLDPEGLSQEFNRHKLCVVPSTKREAFGLVAIESLACGCVPIASRIGGLPEAVGPCGYLVEAGHVDELASAIEDLLDSKRKRENLLLERLQHLSQFTPLRAVSKHLEVLEAVLFETRGRKS
jgi:glycosyltransferase involved in cell wall biosynthesis